MVTRTLACAAVLLVGTTGAADRGRIRAVQHWAYQLQNGPPRPGANIDCLVMDADGDGHPVDAAQVRQLQHRPTRSDRIVLAYFSIGEAESYRRYWKPGWHTGAPPFLAEENPDWKGNFKVRYWDPAWQTILLAQLDRLIDAGFDGVYLDVIDAFEYFDSDGPRPEQATAAADMSRLVAKIAAHARKTRGRPDFLVVPQNGATLIEHVDSAEASRYLDAIDAVGAEDILFVGRRPENNALNPQREALASLKRYRDAGKPILSIEYVTEPGRVQKYLRLAHADGFVPCISRRGLDRLLSLPDRR
jgi:cysteinyl-tRNA synthetase